MSKSLKIALVQPGTAKCSELPLILIHDGSGTIYNYYFIDDLMRPVWAISNENLAIEDEDRQTVESLADDYISLIRKNVPEGRVLLGGWSFGGLIATQIVLTLAQDPTHRALGVIMIDTFCPWRRTSSKSTAEKDVAWGKGTKEAVKEQVLRNIAHCERLSQEWRPPFRYGNSINTGDGRACSTTATPPIVLLKSEDHESTVVSSSALCGDSSGWDSLLTCTMDIPGSHYRIFSFEHSDGMGDRLRQACKLLETGQGKGLCV